MKGFLLISVSHQNNRIEEVGRYHLSDDKRSLLQEMKRAFGLSELMFLSTCNRVEWLMVTPEEPTGFHPHEFVQDHLTKLHGPGMVPHYEGIRAYHGVDAVKHLMEVGSSLDSLVVGEREIITQVRSAYELSAKEGLCADFIRLAVKKTIEAAKEVYTKTCISVRPVSVVSIAFRQLKDASLPPKPRILIIGAGKTNRSMATFLRKLKGADIRVFNRSLAPAQELATELGAEAFLLNDLRDKGRGFDAIITCTAASDHIITPALYEHLLNGETSRKVIIDLSVPTDTHPDVCKKFPVKFIDVALLQEIAGINMGEREKERASGLAIIEEHLKVVPSLIKTRKVELALRDVPVAVKSIKEKALNEVFAGAVNQMDEQQRKVFFDLADYLEKKFNGVPMKMAREILVEGL